MFINLTPHELNVHGVGKVLTIEPSGMVARVVMERFKVAEIDGVEIFETNANGIEGLPENDMKNWYIVSKMFLDATKGLVEHNLFAPGDLIRDNTGRPIGCHGLVR